MWEFEKTTTTFELLHPEGTSWDDRRTMFWLVLDRTKKFLQDVGHMDMVFLVDNRDVEIVSSMLREIGVDFEIR